MGLLVRPPAAGRDRKRRHAFDDSAASGRGGPRGARPILILIAVAAGALRLPFLNHQSLWYDEIFTREIVGESTIAGVWRHVSRTESTPPLYYTICWLLGARSAAAMRAISAVALTAAAPVSYAAFRRFVGGRAALATAAIVGVSPMLVSYSTDARSYGVFVLTGLLTVWGFSAVLERPSKRRCALWTLSCVACVWTHYFGGFLAIAEATVLLLRRGGRVATLGWLLVLAACAGPLVPLAAGQASDARAAFIAREPLSSRLLTTVRQFAMGASVPRAWLEGAGLAVWCLAVGLGAIVAIRSSGGTRPLLALAAISFGLPLLIGLLGIEDRFYSRNVIAAVPIAAALATPAMLRLRALPLACYLGLALAAAAWVATDWRYEQADWRDALSRAEALDPRAPIIAVGPLGAPVVSAYLGRQASPGGVVTTSAWIVVAPARGPHDRGLVASPLPAIGGFHSARTLESHGFRLALVAASRPTRIASEPIPNSTVFPGRL